MSIIEKTPGVILLTGAGASGYFGLATLDELLGRASIALDDEEVMQLLLDVRRSIEAQRPTNAIFEELIAKLRYYRSLVSTLRTDGNIRTRTGNFPPAITTGRFEHEIWKALTKCYRALLDEYGPNNIDYNSSEVNKIIKFIAGLADFNGGYLNLFTTNYDCAYQVFSSNCNTLDFLTRIDNTSGVFSENWHSSREDLQDKQLPNILVHRLHGCVAWFNDEEVPYRIFEIYGSGGILQIRDDNLLHNMCIKLVSSDEIGHNKAFYNAFQDFYENLNTANCLIVWGFSFRDLEVIRAINNSFYTRKIPLKIYYINPFMEEDVVRDNIQRSLATVPVKVSNLFKPKQLKWRIQQSGTELIQSTTKILQEECLNG